MKMTKKFALAPIAAALMFVGAPAYAIPSLQLGISGGTYDAASETVFATSSSFSLYAFLIEDTNAQHPNLVGDTYFVSMSVVPKTSTSASLGSFTYNLNTVNVTADMSFGTPPLASIFPDLGPHGIYPTYYKEVAFNFSTTDTSAQFNTQDHPTWGPQTGTGMYYHLFSINTANLVGNTGIHFDLYNGNLIEKCTGNPSHPSCTTNASTEFAPYSHDAQTMAIPEPETYAMLLAGLGLMGFVARRRSKEQAAV